MSRKRSIQMKFFVDESEQKAIDDRKKSLSFTSKSEYLRTMALSGLIINVDHSALKKMTQELNHIGVNINQITKRLHETNEIYSIDIQEIKESMEKIWQLQRSILSSQP